jgi:hypothetical protein
VENTYFKPYVSFDRIQKNTNFKLNSPEIIQLIEWSSRSGKECLSFVETALHLGRAKIAIEFALYNLQISNSLGLFLARTLHTPLKLDLVKEGLLNPSDYLGVLKKEGISPHELESIEFLLKERGLYNSRNLLAKISRR